MIFFLINKTAVRTDGYFAVPNVCETKTEILEDIRVIPWNEAESGTIKISGLRELKQTIIAAAQQDQVCIKINLNAWEKYGLYLFLPEGITPDNPKNIAGVDDLIDRILTEWAHPMIGNIASSPAVRPQTNMKQYSCWEKAAGNLMDTISKNKLLELRGIMDPLLRSGHDQVRICWDMQTLARAFIGEVTTLATRRIEKIFALKLCSSELLLNAQRAMLQKMLENISAASPNLLSEQFNPSERKGKCGFAKEEYIKYYFVDCEKEEISSQWCFYIALIKQALNIDIYDQKIQLPGIAYPDNYDKVLRGSSYIEWLNQWKLLPPVIQCTVIQNSLRKFVLNSPFFPASYLSAESSRCSLNGTLNEGKIDKASVCQAASKVLNFFVPKNKNSGTENKFGMAWSWNRDENDGSTIFYRECLLPLWAGPSGHSHGNLDFVLSCLKERSVTVGTMKIDAVAAALAGLFAFWRLYYDKRISGVHTIAETFDASIAAAKVEWHGKQLWLNSKKNPTVPTEYPNFDMGEDAFVLLLGCMTSEGVIFSPFLMDVLHRKYYESRPGNSNDERFKNLKTFEEDIRKELSKQYAIPLWTKPVVISPESSEVDFQKEFKETIERCDKLELLRLFLARNEHVFFKEKIYRPQVKNISNEQNDTLRFIYDKLSEGDFAFANYYKDLPQTVNGTEVLGAVILKNPGGLSLENDTLGFTALISIKAAFWNDVRTLMGSEEAVSADCMFRTEEGGIVFSADVKSNVLYTVTENFKLKMSSIKLQSGIDSSGYNLPQFYGTCVAGDFVLNFSEGIESSMVLLSGEYSENKVLGLIDILKFVGLPTDLPVLPSDLSEELFGKLGLKAFRAELWTDTAEMRSIELTISTEKPWSILGNKLKLLPVLYLAVENPFDEENRNTDLQIEGLWTLGTANFHTVIHPASGELSAFLEEGETLDAQAVQSFVGNVSLTDFSVNDMLFCANYKTGIWFASLGTGKCLDFTICSTKIEIDDLELFVEFRDGKLGELEISGCISIGGIALNLQGKYASKDDWEFSASGAENEEINFGELWQKLAEDIVPLSGLKELIPDDFLSFKIGKLYADYSSIQERFSLYLVLEEIKITERFVIDSVFAEIQADTGNHTQAELTSLQTLRLNAAFTIVGLPMELEITKTQGGFRVNGATENDQSIAIGKLLTEFLEDVLGYQAELPEGLTSFTIRQIAFEYEKGSDLTGFAFRCDVAFGGDDSLLAAVFQAGAELCVRSVRKPSVNTQEEVWNYGLLICCRLEAGKGQIINVVYDYDTQETRKSCISLSYEAENPEDVLTLCDILNGVGVRVGEEWKLLTQFGFRKAALSYDFSLKIFTGLLQTENDRSLSIMLKIGDSIEYSVKVVTGLSLSLEQLPVAGGIAGRAVTTPELFSVNDINFYALSEADKKEGLPAGVWIIFNLFGNEQRLQIYQPQENSAETAEKAVLAEEIGTSSKMYWKKLDQTIALFTLHRLGIGMEGGELALALDASLNVRPFTFSLFGAGIRIGLSDYVPHFILNGFGLDFQNDLMTIGGSLSRVESGYQGTLVIQVKTISVIAQIRYDTDGSLFAYAAVNGNIGGTAAFFVTGLALGFAWNKNLFVPGIEQVAQSPLILAATGKISSDQLQTQMNDILTQENGAKVLTAGIRFTMFEIVDTFLLLYVRFGMSFELDLLGTAEVTMPPNCPGEKTPLAYARLALKAAVKPEEGFAGVEARLTPESYILSRDCHLTGGFAFYMWYQGEHSGDFVITFGGYHPEYEKTKPQHYPDVPRVGFLWKPANGITIDGDMYFALTPSAAMAGGRLSAVYELGPLKAYFIAKVDFYLSWRPFSYDASIGIVLGGSLRVKLLFVSVTLKLELGAMLHVWGPDFSAKARVSIWVASFDISFGANANQGERALTWEDFCRAFLPKEKPEAAMTDGMSDPEESTNPLKIAFCSGLISKIKIAGDEYSVLRPDGVQITVESVMPLHSASVNENPLSVEGTDTCVKPMKENGTTFRSDISVTVKSEGSNGYDDFEGSVTKRNLPTAIWGGDQELLCAPCGITLAIHDKEYTVFPEKNEISLDDLYAKGALVIKDAFCFEQPSVLPSYTNHDTIRIFSQTADAKQTEQRRQEVLENCGIALEKPLSLERYVKYAENYFDEEVLIAER